MSTTAPILGSLTLHGQRLKASGYLPRNFPSLVRIRPATAADNVTTEWVAEDYDGQGVVALHREDWFAI